MQQGSCVSLTLLSNCWFDTHYFCSANVPVSMVNVMSNQKDNNTSKAIKTTLLVTPLSSLCHSQVLCNSRRNCPWQRVAACHRHTVTVPSRTLIEDQWLIFWYQRVVIVETEVHKSSPEIDQRHPMTLPADLYANNLVSIACNIASTVYSAR